MISRATDLLPMHVIDELLRLAKADRNWVEWKATGIDEKLGVMTYTAKPKLPTWLFKLWKTGADGFANWAHSTWLLDGPKIFRPTLEQCKALEQIEVNLELHEYAQPYPAILIDLPGRSDGCVGPDCLHGRYAPFHSVVCHRSETMLTFVLGSERFLNDITTTISVDGHPIEASLTRYDQDVEMGFQKQAAKALRVAVNSCLALVNFGCQAQLIFPQEVERDQVYAAENSHRSEAARKRLRLKTKLVSFPHEVRLHHVVVPAHERGEPTGREKSFHWRRGHWAMQVCGVGRADRKRILRKPVMVREDKLLVAMEETATVYRSAPHA